MDKNIDCITWYIKKALRFFFIKAAIIIQINPAIPAVKYDAADIMRSIKLTSLYCFN